MFEWCYQISIVLFCGSQLYSLYRTDNFITRSYIKRCLDKKSVFFIDYLSFSDNCYTFNTFSNKIELILDGSLEPFISIDSLESIPIKFMTNTECRRFLKEDTDQYHKEIICSDTKDLEYRLWTFEQYKVSQLGIRIKLINQWSSSQFFDRL